VRSSQAGILSALLVALAIVPVPRAQAQGVRAAPPYTVVDAQGRHPVTAMRAGDQDVLRLDELADLLQLSVREDRGLNALAISHKNATVVLSLDQPLASVGGRLISMPIAPIRDGARWLVPPDFLGRAMGLIYGSRLDVRRASRLILVGDLAAPRITVQQERVAGGLRITVDSSPRATCLVQQEPRRLLLTFDAALIDVAALPDPDFPAVVDSFSQTDATALALGLGLRFGSYRSSTVPLDGGASRLVLDIQASGPQPQAPPVTAPPSVSAEPPISLRAPAAPAIRTIVIDPGHGGDDVGAKGPKGTLEKDVTLDVARRLKAAIEGRLGIRVILAREDDRLVSLDDRASIANNNKADLFISLHANASPSRESRGAEVFYLSLDGYGEEARRMAENPQSNPLPALGGGRRDVEFILWDMAQARHLAESAVFAGMVEESLRPRVEMRTRSIQQAAFRVLVGANMPAVLVEMGFITNPDQEAQLTSDGFKNAVVQALYEATVHYRDHVEARQ
jgi:N-acetylmuramoyl-L-alanine amidase